MRLITQLAQALSDKVAGFNIPSMFLTLFKTQNLNTAALQISAGASPLVKSGNAIVALVNGVLVYVAAGNLPALSGANVATGSSNFYQAMIDPTGTITWYAGTAATTVAGIVLPRLPVGLAPIGSLLVQNATGSNFVPGTTALDTASLTVTYNNTDGPFFPAKLYN